MQDCLQYFININLHKSSNTCLAARRSSLVRKLNSLSLYDREQQTYE